MRRFLLPLLLLLTLTARQATAQPPPDATARDVMALVRADRWSEAAEAARRYPDPVVGKLVRYFQLMAPNAATSADIAAFMAENPDWPLQGSLARRRDEALAGEPDDAVVAMLCAREPPQALATVRHCLETALKLGRVADANRMARRAWASGITDAAAEQRFLHEHAARLGPADQLTRMERLMQADMSRNEAGRAAEATALRQAARLAPAERTRIEARLALRRDDPSALSQLAALRESDRIEPGVFLDLAAYLRRAGQDEAAQAAWLAGGGVAERAAAERRGAFWSERNIMARRRLRQGDAAGAYAIAAGHAQTSVENAADAEFLAGFIALRRLDNPAKALTHFRRLAEMSSAVITQGRAWYWIGRAEDAAGNTERARTAYVTGARWPSSFYGQLAAMKAGDTAAALAQRITSTTDPAADSARMMDWASRDLARAATYLAGWGEARRAQPFLLRLDEIAPDPEDKALIARLATALGLTETAVALARRAGREGVILLGTGWPQPVTPPTNTAAEPALALGIIRQESSFDSSTVSPVGARGLMQLMPATASQVARTLKLPVSVPALVLDPAYNMRLGTAYLADMLTRFDGAVALAVAAYNAGPARVVDWLNTNGDPRQPTTDVLDWIETIPFGETRNYVQRVVENQVIYRAKRDEIRPHPLAAQLR